MQQTSENEPADQYATKPTTTKGGFNMWGTCSVRLREKIEISETFGEKGEGELANSSLGR